MSQFHIALIVTFTADTYADALKQADQLAEGIGITEEILVSAQLSYDHDNEGQRVLYLHNEEIDSRCTCAEGCPVCGFCEEHPDDPSE